MTYIIKVKDQQRWLANGGVYLDHSGFEVLQSIYKILAVLPQKYAAIWDSLNVDSAGQTIYLQNMKESTARIEKLKEKLKELSRLSCENRAPDNELATLIMHPSHTTTTQLKEAYQGIDTQAAAPWACAIEFIETIKVIEKEFKVFRPLLDVLKEHPAFSDIYWPSVDRFFELSSYHQKSLKKLQKLSTDFRAGTYETIQQTTQKSLIQKTSWAIFYQDYHDKKGGYIDKSGAVGEISSARLFDSDKGALQTANSLRLDKNRFDVVEVEIAFKRRTHLVPDCQSNTLAEVESILEKQLLEALFKGLSLDKIENKLNELKSGSHPELPEHTKPSLPVKRNKI